MTVQNTPLVTQDRSLRRTASNKAAWGLTLAALLLGGAALAATSPASKAKASASSASAPASMSEENCPYHDADPHAQMGGMHDMGHGMMRTPFDAHALERLLDQVKATDAQRAQIRQVGEKARADLKVLHEQMPAAAPAQGGHFGLLGLLTQPQVDGAAAEQARQAMVSHHDAVSKRMLQATLDIANALTPEQRVALGEAMKKRQMQFMHHAHGHHGMHPMPPATTK